MAEMQHQNEKAVNARLQMGTNATPNEDVTS